MILILSISPKGKRLQKCLEDMGEETILLERMVTKDDVIKSKPELIISHGYDKIVKSDVINLMEGRIINAHPSLLPINRGTFPNFWSFIYETPKGITIHNIDSGIDTGAVLIQKEIEFDVKKETFETTYLATEDLMHRTIIDNFSDLKKGILKPLQQQTKGTFHSLKKFDEFKKSIPFEWSENIYDFLKKNDQKIQSFINSWKD